MATIASKCPSQTTKIEGQAFANFLSRHKYWTLKGDDLAGQEIANIEQSKASPRALGSQAYDRALAKERALLEALTALKYCDENTDFYLSTSELSREQMKSHLEQILCNEKTNHSKR